MVNARDDRIEIVSGDAIDENAIVEAVKGCNAVLSALGPTNDNKEDASQMIRSTATGYLIRAMEKEGPHRYVFLSGISVVTPAEEATAATVNAAAVIGLDKKVGPIERGKGADLIVLDIQGHAHLLYRFGTNLCSQVVKDGKTVWERQSF